ncbi:hypothetical protein K443DRAFT_11014 [Laccaria amethystina LaAM-08-1]|uniref:Unplaced genomic scaffold K443scaffold_203, whole genome shotgun sequence n=1 Tax=Laccaria amethystina LaAM-08-1 TaxID=1095629 RepID=A0A0C9WK70_9AGAR|nr:hypothetical protein K443DRAFT_11014 [Laccaria amethystina LaAM-08-1]
MWAVTAAEIFNFNISWGTLIIMLTGGEILSVHTPGRFQDNFGEVPGDFQH